MTLDSILATNNSERLGQALRHLGSNISGKPCMSGGITLGLKSPRFFNRFCSPLEFSFQHCSPGSSIIFAEIRSDNVQTVL